MDVFDETVDLTNDPTTGVTTQDDKDPISKSEAEKTSGKRARSVVWDHFRKLPPQKGQKPKAKCKYCHSQYCCDIRVNGKTTMLTHITHKCKG